MTKWEDIATAAFGHDVMREIYAIYDARKGGYENVDQAAVKRVLDRFPDATDEDRSSIRMWASDLTR